MDGSRPWLPEGAEDLLGLDRQIVAAVRALELLPPGGVLGVVGSQRRSVEAFLARAAWMLDDGRDRLKLRTPGAILASPVWFSAQQISPISHPMAGLANAILRLSPSAAMSVGTEIINRFNRLDDANAPAAMRPGADPAMQRLGTGLLELVDVVRAGRLGKMVVLMSGLEQLSPHRRWQTLRGLTVLRDVGAPINVMLGVDRTSLRSAMRVVEPQADEERLNVLVDEHLTATIHVRELGVRRIGTLLRRYLADAEPLLRSSFGPDALRRLSLAVAHEPLGHPRFLEHLAARVVILAEFVQELRTLQDLNEAQWVWVVMSQRWPFLREYMLTTARWTELRQTLQWLMQASRDPREMVRSPLVQRLEADPMLFRYLRQHAEGFRVDSDGLLRVEALLQDAGL